MKSKLTRKLLAYVMAATVIASTVGGSVIVTPVAVMAEEAYTINVSDAYTFDNTKDWDECGKSEKELSTLTTTAAPKVGTKLEMDVLISGTTAPDFTGGIKPVGIFKLGDNWTWTQSEDIPYLDNTKFTEKVTIESTDYYKAHVAIAFNNATANAVGAVKGTYVKIAGYQCNYSGTIAIANAKIVEPEAYTINVSDSYTFDVTKDWDECGKSEKELSGLTTTAAPKVGTKLEMDVLIPGTTAPDFTGGIKPVGIFKLGDNWTWTQSEDIPYLDNTKFTEKVTIENTDYYKAHVAIAFNNATANAVGAVKGTYVKIAGYQCNYSGMIAIANAKIVEPEEEEELEEKDPTVVADFASSIEGWQGESGWDYSHGKNLESETKQEKAEVEWDSESQSLKMILDYSKDTASGWSEAKISGTFDAVDVSNYNAVTFKLRYPSGMESVRTKLFMADTTGTVTLLNAEGSFLKKTVVDKGDGWSEVTIRGDFKAQDVLVSGITIGIVGPYADLTNVFIDDVTFGQVNAFEDYVKITETVQETGDQVSLEQMATSVKLVDSNATDSAKVLAAYMKALQADNKVLFGHQNSTFCSVHDSGATSDIKDITGSEAGLFGIDTLALAGKEAAGENGFEKSIAASKTAYENGSIVTLSCHMPNFTNAKITATGDENHPYDFSNCDFSESQDLTPCADYILEGGAYNAQYNAYLDIIAEYALALQNEGVPILFRPFHENSGGWFWWGTSTSADSYKAIWKYMVNYLQAKGVHNLLYVYSPNGPISSEEEYLTRYPGDEYVDVLAFDYYDDYPDVADYTGDVFFEKLASTCKVVANLANARDKIPAIAETGIRMTGAGKDSLMVTGNPTKDRDWYNKVINTAVANDIPYFLLWANFNSSNFFVPYKVSDTMGQEMINDFIKAYNNDSSIFGNGTNFYGENGAISRADGVTLTGYSDSVDGYLIAPKDYAVIKEACEFTASVRNAQKVEFVIKTREDDTTPVIIEAIKDSESSIVYKALLSAEALAAIEVTGTGCVSVIAYGTGAENGITLGTAQFVNFNQDLQVMPANVFDNFEYYYGKDELLRVKYGEHNSAAGSSSSVRLDSENKVEGSYGCAFDYTLAYNGSEAWTGGLGRDFDTKDFSKYNAISMWVKPDGNGQKLVIQLRDSNKKEYEVFLSEFVKGTQAQYVTIPFTSFIVKGGTESIDSSDIASYFLWCNTIPENISDTMKDESGYYTVTDTIVFDDIKAIKISDIDLARLETGKYFITSDAQLKDISGESGNNGGGAGNNNNNNNTEPENSSEKQDNSGSEELNKPTTSTETTTVKNAANKKVVVTTTIKKDLEGNVLGTTEKSVIKNAAANTDVTVTIKKDENGTVINATSSISKTIAKGNKLTISGAVAAQIVEAAGTNKVKATFTAKDAEGNTKFKVQVNVKNLVKGNELVIYQLNTKTGEYVMVDEKTYTVSEKGNVSVSMTQKKTYELVTLSEASKINKKIKATVKAEKTSLTVKKGKSAKVKLDSGLNMNNVEKITYTSAKKSVAKVDKNGKVTAVKGGTAPIKITVTLKNGTKKTVTMNIKVK